MRKIIVALAVSAGLAASTIATHAVECALTTSAREGVVQGATGEVLVSGAQGFVQAATGTRVRTGMQLITGNNSTAVLRVDGKLVRVPANARVSFTSLAGGNMCLQVAQAGRAASSSAAAAGSASGITGSQVAVGAGLAALLGGGAIIAIATSKDSVSK